MLCSNMNIKSDTKKNTILEKLIVLMGNPFYISLFISLIVIISPLFVYYDRRYDFFLWRTDTVLGGMEKLNFMGNENFISIGQYIMGTLIYSSLILSTIAFIFATIFMCLVITKRIK